MVQAVGASANEGGIVLEGRGSALLAVAPCFREGRQESLEELRRRRSKLPWARVNIYFTASVNAKMTEMRKVGGDWDGKGEDEGKGKGF